MITLRLPQGSALAACLLSGILTGCTGEASPPPEKPSISYKTRAENAQARIDRTYRLSETEIVKVIIVPGHPYGERCVVYSTPTSSTMHCRESAAQRQ